MNFSIKLVENHSLFLNKLWNIARFVKGQITGGVMSYAMQSEYIKTHIEQFAPHEKALLSKLMTIIADTRSSLEAMNVSDTISSLITFIRDEFADIYLEEYKLTRDGNIHAEEILSYAIRTIIKLLHPYIPFVTEAIWQHLGDGGHLMLSDFPMSIIPPRKADEVELNLVHALIKQIRQIRSDKQIKPGVLLPIAFHTTKKYRDIIEANRLIISGLSKAQGISYTSEHRDDPQWIGGIVKDIDIFVNVAGHYDRAGEIARLTLEINDKKDYIRRIDTKLLNESFVKNAPIELVRGEQSKKQEALDSLKKLEDLLAKIQ